MKLLNREALLQKEELQKEKVDLGKGDFVYVRQMTGYERDLFERSIIEVMSDGKVERKAEDYRAKIAVCTVCGENGQLIFKQADTKVLSRSMSAYRLEKIAEVAQKLNRINAEDQEEIIKNSKGGLAANSISDSVKS
jgi:hypothetical protein